MVVSGWCRDTVVTLGGAETLISLGGAETLWYLWVVQRYCGISGWCRDTAASLGGAETLRRLWGGNTGKGLDEGREALWCFTVCLCVCVCCLLYTSDAADESPGVDLGGRRIIK